MSLVRLFLCVLLTGVATSSVWAQEQALGERVPSDVVDRVSTAFSKGDAELLLTPAADRVEVSLFGTRSFYSSAQSFYVLRHFFESHPPANFTLDDTTASGPSCFVQGRFQPARADRVLQVYVRLVRQGENTWRLHEVRIGSGGE